VLSFRARPVVCPAAGAADAQLRLVGKLHTFNPPEVSMSVAKVSEISATSTKSFEDAINQGLARADKTLRNIKSAWIKEQQVRVEGGKVVEYQVNMMVTFVLES